MVRIHDTYDYKTVFTKQDVIDFAKLTDDSNPFHIDEEFAKRNRFGSLVAQGVLVSCAFSKVLFTKWPGNGDAFFISEEITYLKPVYVDLKYNMTLECVDIDEQRAIGTIEGKLTDNEGTPIVKMKARIHCEQEFSAPKM